MTWVYKVSAHSFYLNGTYQFDAKYSGRPGYKNDSANECVKDNGPLPRGTYTIGPAFYHRRTRAWTMRLTPYIENQMCGRDGFMIHGDSAAHPEKLLMVALSLTCHIVKSLTLAAIKF